MRLADDLADDFKSLCGVQLIQGTPIITMGGGNRWAHGRFGIHPSSETGLLEDGFILRVTPHGLIFLDCKPDFVFTWHDSA